MGNPWKRIFKVVLKTVLWTAGIWLSLMLILETVLSEKVLTGLVNRYAAGYVDGELKFGKVSLSMFRRFPSATITLEDFTITYPADRFDLQEKKGAQSHFIFRGCGQERDTLASFRRFTASLNIPSLLSGTIHIPHIRLDKPRIFAHSYADGSSNWNMFLSGSGKESEPEDTASSAGLPKIVLGRIGMTGHPHIVYTDSRDTVFAMVNMKRMMFNGKINTRRASRSKVGLTLDSMSVAGRLGRDTLSLGLERLYLHENDGHVDVDAAAKAYVASGAFGRMMVPLGINGMVSLDENVLKAEDFDISVAYIPITAEAELKFEDSRTLVKAEASIRDCQVSTLLDKYADNFIPELKGFDTDARISLSVSCDGYYDNATGSLPGFEAHIHRLDATANGLDLALTGKASDLFGNDPVIDVDGGIFADLDSLVHIIPDSLGIKASGAMEAHIKGKARLSQLDMYSFSNSSLTAELLGEDLDIQMPEDSISAVIDGMKIVLGPETVRSKKDSSRSMKLMGITGEIAKADISYKDAVALKVSDFRVAAKNVMDKEVSIDSSSMHPFGGSISASRISFKDSEGSSVRLDSTWNGFQIFPKRGQPEIPVLSLTSRNGRIFLRSDVNRLMLAKADIRASAALNTVERRKKMNAFRDSLSRVYPDIPKDSLFRHMVAQRGTKTPEWMKEEDFRKQDIDISLNKSLAKYFRDWDLKGGIKVDRGLVMTPYFPLKNTLGGFDLDFTNDKVAINRFDVRSGDSDISATGELTGLRRALLGRRGAMKLDVDIESDGMDADQLLAAYRKGSAFTPETFDMSENASDEEFLEHVVTDSTAMADASSLIIVPANLNADISIDASDIRYSELKIDLMTASLTMKERCVQITDAEALSNMGDITLEGFYATRSKKDLKTGFSLNFKDITAEKVISLMPAIDTIMPLLKSFGGLLNCEVAATARLDTNMNLVMPSIDGVLRIGGENLTISNSDTFRSLAKLLMFRNKKQGRINKMTVEGVINDNRLEVFPFILEMDRYTLGLSGVQNMDMSFRYHASLIKSPFLFKLGIDLYGQDFDHMKFKLGKAKYKNKNVPVFSTVIDQTKVNLVESIRNIFDKGVDNAIRDNAAQSLIEKYKKRISYVQAIDQKLEELSADEQKQLEAEQEAEGQNEGQIE